MEKSVGVKWGKDLKAGESEKNRVRIVRKKSTCWLGKLQDEKRLLEDGYLALELEDLVKS